MAASQPGHPATTGTRRALLVVAGTAVGLGVAEGVARTLWVAPWTERLLAEHTRSQSIAYGENRLGLRDADPPPLRAAGERRILMLGDSFTYGLGVADEAEIFPERLERALSAERPGGIVVLNGGIPASLTADWVQLWNRVARDFDPDVLIVVYFLRDGTRSASIPGFFDEIRSTVAVPARDSPLYRLSYLYRSLFDRWSRAQVARRYTQGFLDAYTGDDAQTTEWSRARFNLRSLRDAARARSVAFGLVIFPILVELEDGEDGYPFQPIVDAVAAFARDEGIAVHDLLPAFLGEDGPALWVSPLDQHPNERAHAIAAASLLPFARRLLDDADALRPPQ